MRLYQTMLLAGTILGLGMASPAHADTAVNAGANVNLDNAVKVDTQTDVVTDKVYNNDGEIVATNTTKTVTDTYKFDANNNGILDQDEYVTYSYTMIDRDDDGVVDDVEWNDYTKLWYQPVDVKPRADAFVSYDVDGDGYIDATEYKKAYDVNLYNSWDANSDGSVQMSEYQTMTTTYHDLDNDGLYEWVTVD